MPKLIQVNIYIYMENEAKIKSKKYKLFLIDNKYNKDICNS